MKSPVSVQRVSDPGQSLATALRAATAELAAAGISSARPDAEALAAHLLGVDRAELARRCALGERAPAGLAELVALRAGRVPVQHLTGRAGFRMLDLAVGPGVFVPRPETEVVAGEAIAEARGVMAARGVALVVDLCTGSGAIAVSVAVEVPGARVVALEVDESALAWAGVNVAALAPGVELRLGDVEVAADGVLADLVADVDVVVANPPYIPDGMVPAEVEVRDHDPALALWGGGEDGLQVPSAVVRAAARLLRPGGLLVMEHADVQGPATRALVAGSQWQDAQTLADLVGRPRMLRARRAREQRSAMADSPL